MVLEQLVFIVIALTIFVYMFFRMIKNNDTTYIGILVLEAIGIGISFLEVLFNIKINIYIVVLKYIFSVIIPISIILLEKNGIRLFEIIKTQIVKKYIKIGNTKNAKKILLELLNKNPNSYIAHKLLGEVYEKEGGMRKAIDEYVQAVDLNKKDEESYFKVASLLIQLDKQDEAQGMLFNLLQLKPGMLEATELLGEILIEKEMYKEAASIYMEAIKLNPTNYDLNYNLGIVYTMLNDFQNAKLYYEKAAYLNNLSYNSKYSLAEIALIYKELDEAERIFLDIVEDEELSADAYCELAKIAVIKKEKDKAVQYINIAIDIKAKKTIDKVHSDPIFIPIIAKISIPFNLQEKEEVEEEKKKNKYTKKEKKSKKHLEEMTEITRSLSYNDINLLKKDRKSKENTLNNEEEKYQKEK